jgi:glycosyltransferase involved in cell wall biosynthesis
MKISIITVCYNSASTIRDTFDSVLNQTYTDIDYIVIDGNSKDETVSIIKEYEPIFNGKMRWVSEPDNGLYDAMNKGIRMAAGDIVGILNSDDVFFDFESLEKIIDLFNTTKDIDAVYGDLYYVPKNDTSIVIRKWITGTQRLFKSGWHPAHPTLYIKKDAYDKFGLFNLHYKLASDFEIMLRFIDRHKIKMEYLNDVVIKMRLGGKTNKNIFNIVHQNIEILMAFKENKINVNYLTYPIKRLVKKLLQYKK